MECKKCKRQLPDGSNGKLCENCRGKRAEVLKNAGKTVLGVGGAAFSVVLMVASRGKVSIKK